MKLHWVQRGLIRIGRRRRRSKQRPRDLGWSRTEKETARGMRFAGAVDMKAIARIVPVGLAAALLTWSPAGSAQAGKKAEPPPSLLQLEARLEPLGGSGVSGHFTFTRAGAFVAIRGTVRGLSRGKHGLHVHEGRSCDDPGGHYNPQNRPHGSPDQPHDLRHAGDLGNLVALEDGTARYARVDDLARLVAPQSIAGRVLVVHEGEDDYMSQPAGNSGKPVACGLIGIPAASR
jgi:superoxide dismutase, Cu-Zn family